MSPPKEVIENIRKIGFGIGLDTQELPEEVQAHIEASKKFKKDATRLAKEINTKKPHFIPELIQNAEDNDYDKRIKPRIKFIILHDILVIQNNEKGFNEENVWALCGIGGTTKTNKTLGYIGEKGIGFKSVFMVSNEPHIYSNGFQFEFKYDKNNPVSIIIPYWVDSIPDLVDLTETNIVLLLKEGVKEEIRAYFEKINPSFLLFLRKLKTIDILDTTQDKHKIIERYDHGAKVRIEYGERISNWRLVRKILQVPEHVEEERRKDIRETEIILAFPLNDDETANATKEQDVFAFLPIRKYGFKFIIQADFILPISREDIIKDKEWNKWLRNSVLFAFLDAVEDFKADEKLRYTFYNYIPLDEEVKDDFFLPVVEQIYAKLQNTECVLTDTEQWKKPSDILIADERERKLIPEEDLQNFLGKAYLSNGIKAKRAILRRLGIQEFSFEVLIKCLENTEWIEKQSDEWFVNLYEYLCKQELTADRLECLNEQNIIKLENGNLTSLKEGTVFFPFDKKGKGYGFENELRIISKNTIKPTVNREISDFLKKLGVQVSHPYEIIENHILPIYEDERWKEKDDATLLGYVRYVKDNIGRRYEKESDRRLNAKKKSWETKEDPLKRLKESLFIQIVKITPEENNWCAHPEYIYLPKIYGNENDLEKLFEGIDANFVHPCYIEDIFRESEERKKYLRDKIKGNGKKWKKNRKKYAEDLIEEEIKKVEEERDKKIKEWSDFFLKIGMNSGFKEEVIDYSETYLDYEMRRKLRRGSNDYTAEEITDYKLIPLREILTDLENLHSQKKAKLLLFLLINQCINQWGILSQHSKLLYKWKYYDWHYEYADATWVHLLKTSSWLPTTQGTLAKPSDVFLDIPEIRDTLGDVVPYLAIEIKNKDFIKAFGFLDAIGINTKTNAEGILNYLKILVEEKSNEKSKFERLYEFMNEHFGDDKEAIKNAFSENALIFIPNTGKKFFTSHEVLWKDESDIFGENRGYLEKHYKLKSFFVEKLGISEKSSPKDYSSVLIDLSQKQKKKIDKNDEKIILKIYKELNEHLNPEKVETPISEEEWWKGFIERYIFWTDKKKFWKNGGDLFINDNQELYDLFEDNHTIAFLKLPKNYHPKIQYFIEAVGISYLSKAVQKLPIDEAEKRPEQSLTDQIQNFAPYILRYIYQEEYNTYEKLKKEDVLTQLKSLICYSVKSLQVKYILNGQSVFAKKIAHLYNGNLYIQRDHLDVDYLAVELSKRFGELRGLDDFLISLFDKKTEDKIQNLLRAKGIQELPEDEREWLGIERHISAEEEALEEKEEKKAEKEERTIETHPPEIHSPSSQTESEVRPEMPEAQLPESAQDQEILSTKKGIASVKEPTSEEESMSSKKKRRPEEDIEKATRSGEETSSSELPAIKTSPPGTPIRNREKVITEIQKRDPEPANWVKESYGYHCQICLSREKPEILTYNKSYAGPEANRKSIMEAHHIKEVRNGGHDYSGNYLSLCKHHHKLLHTLNLSLDDVKDSLSSVVDKDVVWPNGEIVRWKMLTLSNEFVEGNQTIQIVINQEHLEKVKEYLDIIYTNNSK